LARLFRISSSICKKILVFNVGLCYSSITPLILPFAMIYFGLAYFSAKYNFVYVYSKANYDCTTQFSHLTIGYITIGILIYTFTVFCILSLKGFPYSMLILMLMGATLYVSWYIYRKFYRPSRYLPMNLCPLDENEKSSLDQLILIEEDKKLFVPNIPDVSNQIPSSPSNSIRLVESSNSIGLTDLDLEEEETKSPETTLLKKEKESNSPKIPDAISNKDPTHPTVKILRSPKAQNKRYSQELHIYQHPAVRKLEKVHSEFDDEELHKFRESQSKNIESQSQSQEDEIVTLEE